MRKFEKQFPHFSKVFGFEEFNAVQLGCYDRIMENDSNMVVSAPTSSGKTTIFQLTLIKQSQKCRLTCLYLAPIKSLCHEKFNSWNKKFKGFFQIYELTSDSIQSENITQLKDFNIVVSTPEKIDFLSRKNLDYLREINLLLVDEIHMLNLQERGGLLEALVSRIMSLNNPRILAVSATIPNIQEICQWLKVPQQNMCVFGEQYRPASLNKVVLGFKSGNNPFLFEKILNYKLLEVIRTYSCGKCSLVFCQTQKGTEGACQQIIADMRQREFIQNDKDLLYLVQSSKSIANSVLQMMVAQGVGFHNAGLSLHDRTLIEKLFLQGKIKVLCTTSTLAMGVNLPARLVVIKSTQCYRGSGKGYQQYTQIELEQMMGRAGRLPFDKEGTVVIMTQNKNYNKYLNSSKLQVLESHLYERLCEHLNAEIMMNSITNLGEAVRYFENSFCFIRMKNSPSSYGIKSSLKEAVQNICMQSLTKLKETELINYSNDSQKIVPRTLGINVARNFIEIQTIRTMLKDIDAIRSEKDFLLLICKSEQVLKFRSKLDERKLLKELNQKINHNFKNTISTPDKKAFVLLQAFLQGIQIDNWEMRKQAKELAFFMKRLTYCLKSVCYERKTFWSYYLCTVYLKYFSLKFNDRNEQMKIKQFPELNEKWKALSLRGFKKLSQIIQNRDMVDCICKVPHSNKNFSQKLQNFREGILISVKQVEQNKNLIKIDFVGQFSEKFKNICVLVGEEDNSLYAVRILNQQSKSTTIAVNKRVYFLACLKENYIGFDDFFVVRENGKLLEEKADTFMVEQNAVKNKKKRKSLDIPYREGHHKTTSIQFQGSKGSKSHEFLENRRQSISKKIQKGQNQFFSKKQGKLKALERSSRKREPSQVFIHKNQEKQDNDFTMRKKNYIPLNEYKCWKPGFPPFNSDEDITNRETISRKLKIRDEPSKKKVIEEQSKTEEPMDPYDYFYKLF